MIPTLTVIGSSTNSVATGNVLTVQAVAARKIQIALRVKAAVITHAN